MKIKKNKLSLNEIYDIRLGNLWLAFIIIACLTGALSILEFTVFPKITILMVVIPVTFLLSLAGMFVLHTYKNSYKLLSMLTALYVGTILSPVFIYCGHETSNNAPLFVVFSLICLTFLLDIKDNWYIYLIVLYINSFVFVKFYLWTVVDEAKHEPVLYFLGFAIVFIAIALSIFIVAIMQERIFDAIRSEIEDSRNKEKAAALAKSRFLANMSGEIRNPMNSIIGLSELAMREDIDDESRSHVDILRQSSYDLLEIIDDVLAYSNLENKNISLMKEEFMFEDLIKRVLSAMSIQTAEKNLMVETDISNNIPRVVYGDVSLIRQVFMRLVFIAMSLTDNGRIMLSVQSENDELGKTAHFICKIMDTGCGLSEADLQAIDGAYKTYDSKQNSNLKGIGLKFNICDEIMRLCGGSLTVNSIVGIGLESIIEFDCDIIDPEPMIRVEGEYSKKILVYVNDSRELENWQRIMDGFNIRPDYVNSYFTFEKAVQAKKYDQIFIMNSNYVSVSNIISSYHCEESTYIVSGADKAYGDFGKCRIIRHPISCINVAKVINGQWDATEYSSRNDNIKYDCSKAKVLVVDDNSVNLKVALGIFKLYKIDIDIAKSGYEALEKAERTAYDIIFMDMVMPEMSGDEALRRMRASNSSRLTDVPVIALTASTGSNVREEILNYGFQEYLAKPIKKGYLTQILLTFLSPNLIKIISDNKKIDDSIVKENVSIPKTPEFSVKDSVLDTKKGIANIGGNESVYFSILNTFYKESKEKFAFIKDSFDKGDINLLTINAHAIKSASGSIGAEFLSLMFKELEAAGKNNDKEFIESHMKIYSESMEDMLKKIKIYLEANNAFSE